MNDLPREYTECSDLVNSQIFFIPCGGVLEPDSRMKAKIKIFMLATIHFYRKYGIDLYVPIPVLPLSENGCSCEWFEFMNELLYTVHDFISFLGVNGWTLYYEHSFNDVDDTDWDCLNNFRDTPLKLFDSFVDVIRETVEDNLCYNLTFSIYYNDAVSRFMQEEKEGRAGDKAERVHFLLEKISELCGTEYFDIKEFNGSYFIIFCYGYIEEILDFIWPDMMFPFYVRELEEILNDEGGTAMNSTKILKKFEQLNKEEYNVLLDDCYLIQDSCSYDTEQLLELHNVARKIVVVLLYIWSRKGLMPDFTINSEINGKKYISCREEYLRCIYKDDSSYSNAAGVVLEKYGWQQDGRWNYNSYDTGGCSFGELWEDMDEHVHSSVLDACYEFDDIPDDGDEFNGYLVEFHNPKLDMVRIIFNNKGKHEQMEKEFAEISSLADFFLAPFTYLPVYENRIVDENNVCHYFSIVPDITDSCGYPYVLDIDRLFSPCLFYKVVKLDELMDNFISKWMFY